MSMKKVLLTTNHPAPYINKWIESINLHYEIDVLYYAEKSKIKAWKYFSPYPGNIIKDLSITEIFKHVKHSDLVILGGWKKLHYLTIILCGLLTHRKLVLFSDYPTEHEKNIRYLIKKIIFRSCFDYIFCATQSTCNYYASTYNIANSKLLVFPYMSMKNLKEDFSYWPKRIKQIQEGDNIRVFIANNFYERKGYRTVLKALEKLKNGNIISLFSFKIAGNGEEFEKYKEELQQLNPEIMFLGWIEDEQYNEMMLNTDIFIHASTFEPFGIPPIDAMKCGKVLIASKGVKSVEGIIENGVSGYYFDPKDDEKLYQILKLIISNKKSLDKIGGQAQKAINKYYKENIIIETIDKVIT